MGHVCQCFIEITYSLLVPLPRRTIRLITSVSTFNKLDLGCAVMSIKSLIFEKALVLSSVTSEVHVLHFCSS